MFKLTNQQKRDLHARERAATKKRQWSWYERKRPPTRSERHRRAMTMPIGQHEGSRFYDIPQKYWLRFMQDRREEDHPRLFSIARRMLAIFRRNPEAG